MLGSFVDGSMIELLLKSELLLGSYKIINILLTIINSSNSRSSSLGCENGRGCFRHISCSRSRSMSSSGSNVFLFGKNFLLFKYTLLLRDITDVTLEVRIVFVFIIVYL